MMRVNSSLPFEVLCQKLMTASTCSSSSSSWFNTCLCDIQVTEFLWTV